MCVHVIRQNVCLSRRFAACKCVINATCSVMCAYGCMCVCVCEWILFLILTELLRTFSLRCRRRRRFSPFASFRSVSSRSVLPFASDEISFVSAGSPPAPSVHPPISQLPPTISPSQALALVFIIAAIFSRFWILWLECFFFFISGGYKDQRDFRLSWVTWLTWLESHMFFVTEVGSIGISLLLSCVIGSFASFCCQVELFWLTNSLL